MFSVLLRRHAWRPGSCRCCAYDTLSYAARLFCGILAGMQREACDLQKQRGSRVWMRRRLAERPAAAMRGGDALGNVGGGATCSSAAPGAGRYRGRVESSTSCPRCSAPVRDGCTARRRRARRRRCERAAAVAHARRLRRARARRAVPAVRPGAHRSRRLALAAALALRFSRWAPTRSRGWRHARRCWWPCGSRYLPSVPRAAAVRAVEAVAAGGRGRRGHAVHRLAAAGTWARWPCGALRLCPCCSLLSSLSCGIAAALLLAAYFADPAGDAGTAWLFRTLARVRRPDRRAGGRGRGAVRRVRARRRPSGRCGRVRPASCGGRLGFVRGGWASSLCGLVGAPRRRAGNRRS